jgi:hypothetical protein
MKLRHWTLVAPFILAVLAIGCMDIDVADPVTNTAFQPVANIDQVMDAIVIPSSDLIFEAIIYSNGELIAAPETLEEWAALEYAALALAESANLLLMPPRLRDTEAWVARSHELTDASMEVLRAARAQDVDELLVTGSVLYTACLNCHEEYILEPVAP